MRLIYTGFDKDSMCLSSLHTNHHPPIQALIPQIPLPFQLFQPLLQLHHGHANLFSHLLKRTPEIAGLCIHPGQKKKVK